MTAPAAGRKDENMNWYVIFFWDDTENEYFKAANDEEAMRNTTSDIDNIAEIHRCNDDETLSPQEQIYPIIAE